jgi:ion channel-forming bestrophin family protein
MLLNPDLRFSQTLRITWRVDLIMIALCSIAYWLEVHVLRDFIHIPASIPTLLGTSIAFFVGFNNNQAYSRWWEARTIWGGLVNDSRSWTRNVLNYSTGPQATEPLFGRPDEQTDDLPLRMVRRHLSFLYALKRGLRGNNDQVYLDFLNEADKQAIARFTNIPAALLDMQTRDLQQLRTERRIDGYGFLTLNDLIVRFSDGMGASERIKNTPFPVTYLYFTRVFIWVLVTLLTMVIADEAGAWSIGLGWLVGFVFHVTQINGISLMNPFDGLPASVALDSIVRTIEINTLETLKAPQIPLPIETVNGEYIL